MLTLASELDGIHGTLEMHYQRKQQTASNSRKFSLGRFMSSGVQKPREKPLKSAQLH